jgi:hypothetical protein
LKKLLKIVLPVVIILGLILAAGCASGRSSAPSAPVPAPMPAPAPLPPGLGKDASRGPEYIMAPGEAGDTDLQRKIVRTGNITLQVDDIDAAMADIATIAKDFDGYVVSSDKQGDIDVSYGTISIRIAASHFDEAFDRIRKLGVKVPNENTESQDVTEEYSDLNAQLRNLQATEAQYLELLKKAETVEDTLKVYQALSDVRGRIEQVQGRIQYLDRTSDMSLIQVNLRKTRPISEAGWSASDTLKSAIRGLFTFGKVLANIVIWLAIFSPIWIITLVLVLYFKKWRKPKTRTSR